MEQQKEYMVCVKCMTYNHAPYITDAMNGFTMQETTFPYVCVIVDDASSDEEQDIITKYLQDNFDLEDKSIVRHEETDNYVLTFAQHKTNKNCYFAVLFLKYNHYSIRKTKAPYIAEWTEHTKYIALCEGDDYWIDHMKLQKQVIFFSEHPKCGFVYTAYHILNENNGVYHNVFTKDDIKHDDKFKWRLLEQKVIVGTCTTMMENNLFQTIINIKDDFQGFTMGDTQLWFNAARLSQVGYIREITSVYRKHVFGATATFQISRRILFIKNCLQLDLHLAKKYGSPSETIKEIKSIFGFGLISLYIKNRDYLKARKINAEHFNNSIIINFIISFLDLFKIHNIKGIGLILKYIGRTGIINFE